MYPDTVSDANSRKENRIVAKLGSLQNQILAEKQEDIEPEIGMGATELCWTDRHAYTIVAVHPNGRLIEVTLDYHERTDDNGMSENQHYRYETDENAPRIAVSKRKDGKWRVVNDTRLFVIGYRDEYHDYSF